MDRVTFGRNLIVFVLDTVAPVPAITIIVVVVVVANLGIDDLLLDGGLTAGVMRVFC